MAKNRTWEEDNFFLDKNGQKDAEKNEDFKDNVLPEQPWEEEYFFLKNGQKQNLKKKILFFMIKMARKTLRKWGFF